LWSRHFWEGVNNYVPKVAAKPNKRYPWITKKNVTLIRRKNELFKIVNDYPHSAEHLADYKTACKVVRKECMLAQEQYLWYLGRGKNGQQKLWKHIHEVNGQSNICDASIIRLVITISYLFQC
jgi:hypothetical protein